MENIKVNESEESVKFGVLTTNKNILSNETLEEKDIAIDNLIHENMVLKLRIKELENEINISRFQFNINNNLHNIKVENNNLNQEYEYDDESMKNGYIEMGEINLELSK